MQIWAVQTRAHADWFRDELARMSASRALRLSVQIYVTGEAAQSAHGALADELAATAVVSEPDAPRLAICGGRPQLGARVGDFIGVARCPALLYASGPDSLVEEVRCAASACAAGQRHGVPRTTYDHARVPSHRPGRLAQICSGRGSMSIS